MSNRDFAKNLIDQIPESKLLYITAYLQGAAIPENILNSETLEAIEELESHCTLSKGTSSMESPKERLYTADEIYDLPNFLRLELFDGKIYTDDWTSLIIDDDVFQNPPSGKNHVAYKLSVVKNVNKP